MRIGIFSDAYKPLVSGVTTSLQMLVEGLKQQGHEVFVITVSAKGAKEYDKDHPYIYRIKGMPIPKKGLTSYRFVRNSKKHLKYIESLNLDVIHVHSEFTIGSVAIKVKKKLDIPMVFTVHTMYEEYLFYVSKFLTKLFRKSFMKALKKLMARFILSSEVTLTPSEKIKDLMLSYNIDGNYKIVPSGIDLSKFKKSNYKEEDIKNLKISLGIKENEFVCLFIGRISNEKSIDVLIDGFAASKNENMKFLVVGDGPALSKLESQIKKLDLKDKVILTGMIPWEQVGLYYQLGDCFLNASISETQGLTYIEALAAELPLVVKYDKVLEAVVEDSYNGLFFKDNNELPALLNKIYKTPELLTELKKNTLISVKKYSREVYAKNALNAYAEAIEINKTRNKK